MIIIRWYYLLIKEGTRVCEAAGGPFAQPQGAENLFTHFCTSAYFGLLHPVQIRLYTYRVKFESRSR